MVKKNKNSVKTKSKTKSKTKVKTKVKTKSKRKTTMYTAKVGCWNCDEIYTIKIVKGVNIPEYLQTIDPACRRCECKALRIYAEYKVEKEVLKELVLHARLDHSHEIEPTTSDHSHYG